MCIRDSYNGAPIFVGLGGLAILMFWVDYTPISAIPAETYRIVVSPTLPTIPLFTFAGYLLAESRASERLINVFKELFGWIPGGTPVVIVLLCGFFTALTGGSGVTILALGGLLLPMLLKDGYSRSFSLGLITVSGAIGLLFPPSLPLIIYGVTVQESIAKLFIAGIIPGLMIALIFMTYVIVWSLINKKIMPKIIEEYSFFEKIKRSKQLLPVIILILAVIGSIYTGIATATEAASLGVVGALILSYFQKSLTLKTFKSSLLGATKTSCMIAFILAGSTFLSLAMGFTGLPRNLALWIQNMELSPYVLIFVLMIFYIILGMFLDGISAVVLTMAIIEPMIRQAGFDMIWFGIFLVIVVEMAQITPPVGFNLFVLQGMAKKDMGYIARSAFPLFLLMVLAVILVVIFPEIALWMPEQMIKNIN